MVLDDGTLYVLMGAHVVSENKDISQSEKKMNMFLNNDKKAMTDRDMTGFCIPFLHLEFFDFRPLVQFSICLVSI